MSGIIWAILIFSLVVIIHELGHFLLAKKNGITVYEFSLGMGPTLLHFEKGGTKYCLKLLPIGGSCMMGEDDTEDDTPNGFNNKSVWARMSVIAGGPLFNFILALVCSVIMVGWFGYDRPVISGVIDGYSAQEAGMQAGDKIVKMNNKNIHLAREITMYTQFHQGESVEIVYERDGVRKSTMLEPKPSEEGMYLIGLETRIEYKRGNILETLQHGIYTTKYWIDLTFESLKMLVSGKVGVKEMAGPVGIVDFVGDTYNTSKSGGASSIAFSMIQIIILLSANLGIMNLLPIPALDGGRLVFLIIEAIRGKRIPPEKEGMVHFAGFVLLMVLMAVIMYNDIVRLL